MIIKKILTELINRNSDSGKLSPLNPLKTTIPPMDSEGGQQNNNNSERRGNNILYPYPHHYKMLANEKKYSNSERSNRRTIKKIIYPEGEQQYKEQMITPVDTQGEEGGGVGVQSPAGGEPAAAGGVVGPEGEVAVPPTKENPTT